MRGSAGGGEGRELAQLDYIIHQTTLDASIAVCLTSSNIDILTIPACQPADLHISCRIPPVLPHWSCTRPVALPTSAASSGALKCRDVVSTTLRQQKSPTHPPPKLHDICIRDGADKLRIQAV